MLGRRRKLIYETVLDKTDANAERYLRSRPSFLCGPSWSGLGVKSFFPCLRATEVHRRNRRLMKLTKCKRHYFAAGFRLRVWRFFSTTCWHRLSRRSWRQGWPAKRPSLPVRKLGQGTHVQCTYSTCRMETALSARCKSGHTGHTGHTGLPRDHSRTAPIANQLDMLADCHRMRAAFKRSLRKFPKFPYTRPLEIQIFRHNFIDI